jgi:hypothetical protein
MGVWSRLFGAPAPALRSDFEVASEIASLIAGAIEAGQLDLLRSDDVSVSIVKSAGSSRGVCFALQAPATEDVAHVRLRRLPQYLALRESLNLVFSREMPASARQAIAGPLLDPAVDALATEVWRQFQVQREAARRPLPPPLPPAGPPPLPR